MNRKIWVLAMTGALALGNAVTSYAGWKQDDTGYWWQNEDGSYLTNGWHWLDGNGDGISECYYFDGNGYMAANTTTPDGYTVDGSGAWIADGVVQTRNAGQTQGTGQASQGEAQLESGSFVVGDKIIRGDLTDMGDFSIVMTNLDGSGRQKLLDVYTVGGEQVVYGDSAYIVAQQEVNGAVHSVLLRARLDGSVETVVDLAEGFYHVFRNGNRIVIDLSRNNKYEYYYITPDDYTLRSYEGERPMAGGSAVYFDHEGTPESLGYYSADDYRVEDGNTIVTLDENGNMKQADRSFSSTGGNIGKITVMWGNDAYTLIRITWENPNSLFAELSQVTKTYKLTVGGGAVEELNGNVYIYEGNVYYRAPEALYRWDYQGNATKLMDRPGTLYFQNGYAFSRDGYNIVGIKL